MDNVKLLEQLVNKRENFHAEVSKVIVGQRDVLEYIFIALLCKGHVLLQGVPGLGKTLIIKNPHLKKALDYLGQSLSSSADPSGGVFYPDYFGKNFVLNDLTALQKIINQNIKKKDIIGILFGIGGGLILLEVWKFSFQELTKSGNLFFIIA